MSELHDLCKFPTRPIDQSYIDKLTQYLKDGIPQLTQSKKPIIILIILMKSQQRQQLHYI